MQFKKIKKLIISIIFTIKNFALKVQLNNIKKCIDKSVGSKSNT